MPQHASAEKRMRTSEKRRQRNRGVKAVLRKAIKDFQTKLATPEAPAAFREVESVLAKSAKKGVIKKRTASRRTSRLALAINRAQAQAQAPAAAK